MLDFPQTGGRGGQPLSTWVQEPGPWLVHQRQDDRPLRSAEHAAGPARPGTAGRAAPSGPGAGRGRTDPDVGHAASRRFALRVLRLVERGGRADCARAGAARSASRRSRVCAIDDLQGLVDLLQLQLRLRLAGTGFRLTAYGFSFGSLPAFAGLDPLAHRSPTTRYPLPVLRQHGRRQAIAASSTVCAFRCGARGSEAGGAARRACGRAGPSGRAPDGAVDRDPHDTTCFSTHYVHFQATCCGNPSRTSSKRWRRAAAAAASAARSRRGRSGRSRPYFHAPPGSPGSCRRR